MDSETSLLLGIVFGAIGLGYCMYAKQQRKGMALLAGVGLIVFPYFVSSVWLSLVLGVALVLAPWFLRF